MATPQEILRVLDDAARACFFPMLDNGYVYLAASRMSLHRSDADWALVVEIFGYSPRAGLPDLCISTYGSRLRDRDPRENYVSAEAYENYLATHPNDDSRFFYPIESGAWEDPEDGELIARDAEALLLRGEPVELPRLDELRSLGFAAGEAGRSHVFEVCRYLASKHRERVLATPLERRISVPAELEELLVLDEWTHPDLAESVLPSEVESFQQIALALASGEPRHVRPGTQPNNHWSNWPEGGTL